MAVSVSEPCDVIGVTVLQVIGYLYTKRLLFRSLVHVYMFSRQSDLRYLYIITVYIFVHRIRDSEIFELLPRGYLYTCAWRESWIHLRYHHLKIIITYILLHGYLTI